MQNGKATDQERWYFITYQVTENGETKEYSLYGDGISATHAAVRGVTAIYETYDSMRNVSFVDIRNATPHETKTLEEES